MRQVPTASYYRQIITLFILIIVDELGFWVLLPVLAPLVAAQSDSLLLHTSPELRHLLFGIIMAISPLCSILGAPLLGFISDHIGRKKVLIVCLSGTLAGYILYAFSFWLMNLGLLILARIIVGLTTASQGIVQAAMVDLSDGKRKAINISTIACAMTIPLIIGPLLGGYFSDASLVSWFNRATPFIVITLLSLLNLMMLCWFFKETLMAPKSNINIMHYLPSIFAFFKQPHLRYLLIAFFCMELGWSLYFQAVPLLLVEKWNFTGAQLGLFTSFIGSVMSLSLIFLTRIAVRFFNISKILLMNLLLAALALLLGFIFTDKSVLWLTAACIATGVGLSYTSFITTLSNNTETQHQGLLMGLTDALLFLAFACTGLLAGILSIFSVKLPILTASLFILSGYCVLHFKLKKGHHTLCVEKEAKFYIP